MPTIVLAVDAGSTSTKAQRFDERGRPVGELARTPSTIDPDGTADANAFADAVDAAIDAAMAEPDAPPPDGVALSCAWHGLLGVDGDGRPVTRLSTWLDVRAADEAAELQGRVADVDAVHQRTGAPLHPSFLPARLLWLARHDSTAFAAAARWLSPAEVLAARWFGRSAGPSLSMASATGLFDQRAGWWDEELVGLLDLSVTTLDRPDDDPRTGLSPDYAARWPELADVPWFPALGDGAAAVVGSGCGGSDRAALTVGTSAAVRVRATEESRNERPLPPALFGYLLERRAPIVGAAFSNAGNLTAWATQVLRLDAADPVAAATASRRPGSHGLLADPSLCGERSPRWSSTASGALSGLRMHTDGLDVLQALVEAAALRVAEGVAALDEWAGAPPTLVLSGGAAASGGWRHLLADAIGRPIVRSDVAEVSARGAAIAALERLGAPVTAADLVADGEVIEPDPGRAGAFAALRGAGRA